MTRVGHRRGQAGERITAEAAATAAAACYRSRLPPRRPAEPQRRPRARPGCAAPRRRRPPPRRARGPRRTQRHDDQSPQKALSAASSRRARAARCSRGSAAPRGVYRQRARCGGGRRWRRRCAEAPRGVSPRWALFPATAGGARLSWARWPAAALKSSSGPSTAPRSSSGSSRAPLAGTGRAAADDRCGAITPRHALPRERAA